MVPTSHVVLDKGRLTSVFFVVERRYEKFIIEKIVEIGTSEFDEGRAD